MKSIVPISRKNDVDPGVLFGAFIEAWKNVTANCGDLKVSRRVVNEKSAVFLVTRDDKVVSQFPIDITILENPTFFENYIKNIVPLKSKTTPAPKFMTIDKLGVRMKGVCIEAKVVEIPPKRLVNTRWGNQSYISNVKISDDTGSIKLSLWNNQIDSVHVGDIIKIQNCSVISFRGDLQLKLGRKGKLSLK